MGNTSPTARTRPAPKPDWDVIVLGGGVSGLAAAAYLTKKGCRTLVVEARERLGGRIHSAVIGTEGGKVDVGASFVHGKYDNPIYDLAQELGVPIHYNTADHKTAMIDRNEHVDSNKVSELFGIAMDAFFSSSQSHSLTSDPAPSESLGSFIATHLSTLPTPLTPLDLLRLRSLFKAFSGWTGASAEKVSLRWWGTGVDTLGPDGSVMRGGYGMIVEHLEREGGEVRLGAKVVGVEYREEDALVAVHIQPSSPSSNPTTTTLTAPHVLCTLPLGVLQSSPPLFDPPLPPRKLRATKELKHGILNKVVVKYDEAWWMDKETTALYTITPTLEDPHALAPPGVDTAVSEPQALLVHNYKLIDGSNKLLIFMDADYAYAIESPTTSLADITTWAHTLLTTHLLPASSPVPPPPRPSDVLVTAWASDPYSCGSYTYIPAGMGEDGREITPLDLKELAGAMWDGALGFAGEHTNMERYASVHGAYESGLREAKRIDIERIMQRTGERWGGMNDDHS